jgi:hypothetical protein
MYLFLLYTTASSVELILCVRKVKRWRNKEIPDTVGCGNRVIQTYDVSHQIPRFRQRTLVLDET